MRRISSVFAVYRITADSATVPGLICYSKNMRCFFIDSTLRYSNEKGFGESYYILCQVCWNSSIKVKKWEDGTEETSDCPVCERMIRTLNDEQVKD
jgi:hypothetical protein